MTTEWERRAARIQHVLPPGWDVIAVMPSNFSNTSWVYCRSCTGDVLSDTFRHLFAALIGASPPDERGIPPPPDSQLWQPTDTYSVSPYTTDGEYVHVYHSTLPANAHVSDLEPSAVVNAGLHPEEVVAYEKGVDDDPGY